MAHINNTPQRDKFSELDSLNMAITAYNHFYAYMCAGGDDDFVTVKIRDYERSDISAIGVGEFCLLASFVDVFDYIPLRYSKGEAMTDIVAQHNADLLKGLTYYAKVLQRINQSNPDIYSGCFGVGEGFRFAKDFQNYPSTNDSIWAKLPPTAGIYMFDLHGLHVTTDAYALLAWLICTVSDRDSLCAILPLLLCPGRDRLLDIVCGYFQPDRPNIATHCADPATYGLLAQVVDAPEPARAGLVQQYLENWPAYMGKLKQVSQWGGVNVLHPFIETREDLQEAIGSNFTGYWAWEAALVVKFFNLDDSAFKDNEYYPDELVNFIAPLKTKTYIESISKIKPSVPVTALPYNGLQENELLIDTQIAPQAPLKKNYYYDSTHKNPVLLYDAYLMDAKNNCKKNARVRYRVGYVPCTDPEYNLEYDNWLKTHIQMFDKYNDSVFVDDDLSVSFAQLFDNCLRNMGTLDVEGELNKFFVFGLATAYATEAYLHAYQEPYNCDNEVLVRQELTLGCDKFRNDGVLFIRCEINDMQLCYRDVYPHFNALVTRFGVLLGDDAPYHS